MRQSDALLLSCSSGNFLPAVRRLGDPGDLPENARRPALKQLVAEQGGGAAPGTGPSGGSGSGSGGTEPPETPAVPHNRYFHMSVKLDNTRVNRDVNTYVQEIVQHLLNVDGSEVELQLEVEVNAPDDRNCDSSL